MTIQSKIPFGLLATKETAIARVATAKEAMVGIRNLAEKMDPVTSIARPMKEIRAYSICNNTLVSPILFSSRPMRKKSRGVSRANPTNSTPTDRRIVATFFIGTRAYSAYA